VDESDRDSGVVGVVMVADDLPIETEAADRADFPADTKLIFPRHDDNVQKISKPVVTRRMQQCSMTKIAKSKK